MRGFILFMIFASMISVEATSEDPSLDMEKLYNEGVDYYLDNKWDKCVKSFEMALEDWHWWKNNTARCNKDCSVNANIAELLSPNLTPEDESFERMVHNTLCLVKCKRQVFGKKRMDVIPQSSTLKKFEEMKPYDYLQLCYYQNGRLKDAANAALTVLAVQADHEIMRDNLNYYQNEANLEFKDLINLEARKFVKTYELGEANYQAENFEETVTYMEQTFDLYLEEYDKCRWLCDAPFDHGWLPDFISSVANHFTYTLRCKAKCHKKLSTFYGNRFEELLPSIMNYLQFSYYKLDNIKKAAEAVESFLVISPDDAVQIMNKQYYSSLEDVNEDYFTARDEIVKYLERIEYEADLLQFIDTQFVDLDDNIKESEDLKEKENTIKDSLTTIITNLWGNGLKEEL